MNYDLLDLIGDSKREIKKENKRKLHALLDKYGSVEEIERSGELKDGFEFDFARVDGALEEVLEERRRGYREPLSYNKENSEKSELDVLREKVDEVNREVKVANNEYAGIKSDARVEKEDNKKGYKQADDIQKQRILSPNEIITDYLNDNFYSTLGYKESSNDYHKRLNDKQGIGAVGKYQFRKPAFQETGFMDKNGNFTGKYGVNSVRDFLNNPEVQEKAVRELLKKNYNYMINYKVLHLLGNTISGKVADFPITISGMLAASHKEGGPMTAKYLKSLEKNKDGLYYLPYHKYKGNTLRSFLAIETRLREFSELNTDN